MKNILIVVDMQNGFMRYEQTRALGQRVEALLASGVFDVVIGTRFLNETNSTYEKLFGWTRLKSEQEREIPSAILKHMDYVQDKYIYSCMNASFLQRLCQLNDGRVPEKVFIAGADTDCCVLSTAAALFEHNIRPIVLTEYCASNGGPDAHAAGLLCLTRLIGSNQLVSKHITDKAELDAI